MSMMGWVRLLVAVSSLGLFAFPAAANPGECAALEGTYAQTRTGLV